MLRDEGGAEVLVGEALMIWLRDRLEGRCRVAHKRTVMSRIRCDFLFGIPVALPKLSTFMLTQCVVGSFPELKHWKWSSARWYAGVREREA